MPAALQFPAWLKPEIIPGLPLRWYGLMYVVAFAVSWFLFRYESKRRAAPWSVEDAEGWFFWAIIGLLVGARIFGTLVYDPSGYYRSRPWLIFWPFDEGMRFTGFQGMSYHGGFFGLIASTLIYCAVKKRSWLAIADVIAVSAPLGYTFGRLGNFINGELWGKVSSAPIGMIFPTVPDSGRFKASLPWVQEAATKAGIRLTSMNELVNLPRHPSQLYEALFEGLALWLVLWLFVRKRESFRGFATGLYAIGYGAVRFAIEYFREPDQGMGYILGDKSAPTYVVTSAFNISMGQILSAVMMLCGAALLFFASRAARSAGNEGLSQGAAQGQAGTTSHNAHPAPRSAAAEARRLRKRIK
jgi:phosphatidylglycerol---prolipoprotein diacylglyceryl transferase